MSNDSVTVIGAGLAGSLLSIYLARRGFRVNVFEARSDMRSSEVEAGRSINLALSDRGIAALREVGMDEYMLAEAVPMYGRMIHGKDGDTKLLPYSGREGEFINSVSRSGLNIALMNEAEKYPNVQFVFSERCTDLHLASGEVMFASGRTMRSDTVIATDGAGSPVRQAMERQMPDFSLSSAFLDHGYKELHIPQGSSGEFLLERNALHIWPRHKFMMIALPNFDGSFTCTLFLAHKGGNPSGSEGVPEPGFDQLTDEVSVLDFFTREFPDAVPLMPTLVEDFFANPTGQLGTIKCWPWNFGGKVLLLGDSAHAVVPFYGQGMNCAFEDVRVLDGLIEKHDADWAAVYEEYGRLRKVNTDAIADLAEENFYEMRDATADPVFQRKRELETRLEHEYPDYFSKYSMVTFREDLPYSVAKERGNAQDRLLMEICSSVDKITELDIDSVVAKLRQV
ncbi:MAG TPA: NAD(P)/FAD-dependent oxidoreductase [Pyrinomonadaceae bacterium]|nr:NAD(P)/FAD-dependent oxidoreductase [Pyrinomonadaceae bacterium]HMP65309.1 NAD(P)/FAD-dependent oxidoreductase [Pyrinomonadaceae bacterium]